VSDGNGKLPGGYGVGYGKPPKHTRWKPNQSGNSKGRPKRALGKYHQLVAAMDEPTRAIFMDEMHRLITLPCDGGQVTLPVIQTIIRAMAKSALTGGQQAQRTAIMIQMELERDLAKLKAEVVGLARRVKAKWGPEFARRRALGIAEPDFLPHPDDIYIDEENQHVEIRGPGTPEEKAELDEQLRKRDMWEEDFGWARETYEKVGRTELGLLNALLSQNNYDLINLALPARYQKKLNGRLPNPLLQERFMSLPERHRKVLKRLPMWNELSGERPGPLRAD
jgi:hypothetical protein